MPDPDTQPAFAMRVPVRPGVYVSVTCMEWLMESDIRRLIDVLRCELTLCDTSQGGPDAS